MSIFRRRPTPTSECTPKQDEQELRLVEAENRANHLLERAEWLHAVVIKRDLQNHWQDSVNQLFQGGTP